MYQHHVNEMSNSHYEVPNRMSRPLYNGFDESETDVGHHDIEEFHQAPPLAHYQPSSAVSQYHSSVMGFPSYDGKHHEIIEHYQPTIAPKYQLPIFPQYDPNVMRVSHFNQSENKSNVYKTTNYKEMVEKLFILNFVRHNVEGEVQTIYKDNKSLSTDSARSRQHETFEFNRFEIKFNHFMVENDSDIQDLIKLYNSKYVYMFWINTKYLPNLNFTDFTKYGTHIDPNTLDKIRELLGVEINYIVIDFDSSLWNMTIINPDEM